MPPSPHQMRYPKPLRPNPRSFRSYGSPQRSLCSEPNNLLLHTRRKLTLRNPVTEAGRRTHLLPMEHPHQSLRTKLRPAPIHTLVPPNAARRGVPRQVHLPLCARCLRPSSRPRGGGTNPLPALQEPAASRRVLAGRSPRLLCKMRGD